MAKFQISNSKTLRNEGGWHNGSGANKFDRGGETFRGIARKIWPNWAGWQLIDALKSSPQFPTNAETHPEVNKLKEAFYIQNFWNPLKLDSVQSQDVADELYDTAVNMGVGTAATFLQRAINLANRRGRLYANIAVDGAVGFQTLAALNSLDPVRTKFVFNLLNVLQGGRYVDIMEKDESQEENALGWFTRIEIQK